MRLERIAAHELVLLRIKDRLIYGEVLETTDGAVRFRPLCPAAGWHRSTARQIVGHWRKTGRRGGSVPDRRAGQPSSTEQLLFADANT